MNSVIEEYNDFISHKEDIIKETLEQLEEVESEEEDYKRSVQKKQMDDYNVLKSQCFELREKIDSLKSERDSFIKELRNYIDISKKESTDKLLKLDESLTDANQRLTRFELDIQTLESDKRKEISNYENLTEELNREIYKITSTIETIESQIENLQKEYKGLDSTVNIKEEIIKKENIESLILEMQQDYNNQSNYKRHLEYALGMMKDNGIKTSIINKYIPIINKLINSYLQTMDLFVQYELDETFNESIKSRYRDEFSYDSFSEGEKARIDLAILFTFRAISKMKSTSATNLLLLDETFDGSIDADGSDSISAILRTLTDTHVFCISHNEKMFDKFHSLIKFEKIQNYSVMC
jgi:DNA repair exonuclease SbcCD ATPase subunit